MRTAPNKLSIAWVSALATIVMLCASARTLAESSTSAGRRNDRAAELEQRLVAPCCWQQTLDVHESELSSALRIEIRQRLDGGEAPAAIEDDFAVRFGERIRAVPGSGSGDPRVALPVAVGFAMVLSLFGLLGWVRRGRKRVLQRWEARGLDDNAAYDLALERELARDEVGATTPGGARPDIAHDPVPRSR
jgi:cytochrome c-type biogenesis protein CcmH